MLCLSCKTIQTKEMLIIINSSFKFSFMKKIVSFKEMRLWNKKMKMEVRKKTALMMLYLNKYDWSGLPAFKSLGYLSQSLLLLQHQHAKSQLNTSNHSCDRTDVRVPRHKIHTHFWLGWSKNEKSNFQFSLIYIIVQKCQLNSSIFSWHTTYLRIVWPKYEPSAIFQI